MDDMVFGGTTLAHFKLPRRRVCTSCRHALWHCKKTSSCVKPAVTSQAQQHPQRAAWPGQAATSAQYTPPLLCG